jgi:hypothetical protein
MVSGRIDQGGEGVRGGGGAGSSTHGCISFLLHVNSDTPTHLSKLACAP